ncbi:MAG TPA: nicotinate phosphoribosyltransferase, partial [Treponemataceae bacterium]|nr:nicotinate phosphoribosyltransferase [Treponemataceae bacterium]
MNNSALFTDFYELTMAQGYWKRQSNHKAVFDMFFRRQPFSGGFSVFSGLDPLLDAIESFRFSPEDIAFLDSQKKFEQGFLDYLSNFRFTGEIHAMKEGTIVFPNEPLLRIHANIIEAEIIEG